MNWDIFWLLAGCVVGILGLLFALPGLFEHAGQESGGFMTDEEAAAHVREMKEKKDA